MSWFGETVVNLLPHQSTAQTLKSVGDVMLVFMSLASASALAISMAEPDREVPLPQLSGSGNAQPSKLTSGERKYQSIFPVNTSDQVLEPLKAEEGTWDAEVELFVGDLAKQPIRKKGVQTNRLTSKGNAIINEFRYVDGSYEGTGMWGWDAYSNRYTGTWIDSDTHLVRHDVGYYDPKARSFRWEADTLQPDGATTRMRIAQKFGGDVRTFQIDVMDAVTGEYKKLIYMTFRRRA